MKKYIKKAFNFLGFELSKHNKGNGKAIKSPPYLKYIKNLKQRYSDFSLTRDEEGVDKVFLNNFIFNIKTEEEYYILNEIFFEDCYDLSLPSETVFFDIGLNVGITSIYFSNKKEVSKIYSFEPVNQTYEDAIENIKLNPNAKEKITSFNFGLGNQDRKMSFYFNPEFKGSVGIVDSENIEKGHLNKNIVEVDIVDATDCLKPFVDDHKEKIKVLKIDCEGGEFEIIENLFITGLLVEFKVIMIEWHKKNPISILNKLIGSNFILHQQSESKDLGMIYAFNNNG